MSLKQARNGNKSYQRYFIERMQSAVDIDFTVNSGSGHCRAGAARNIYLSLDLASDGHIVRSDINSIKISR